MVSADVKIVPGDDMLKSMLIGATALSAVTGAAAAQQRAALPAGPPTYAEPGQCYQRVRLDAVYNTVTETIVTQDRCEEYAVRDARLEAVTRDYVSREAGMRYIVTEPIYETRTEQVLVRPAYTEYEVVPAVHETVTERVLVREARMVWRRGHVPGARAVRHDPETGDVWCLVEEPAEYRTVTRNVVVRPAQLREVTVPAEYATIEREVLVQEASVREAPIAEERSSYAAHVLAGAAQVDSRVIEGRTVEVDRFELVSGERYEWRVVDCDALEDMGYAHPSSAPQSRPAPQRPHAPAPGTEGEHYGITPGRKTSSGDEFDYEAYESAPVASVDRNAHPGLAAARAFARR